MECGGPASSQPSYLSRVQDTVETRTPWHRCSLCPCDGDVYLMCVVRSVAADKVTISNDSSDSVYLLEWFLDN